ncbi:30S ribosomal protein S11 [Candidatus Dojkabacteria bacterium]|nr:30S ribosomal protein S11 [Candidatus Dojkabacteria bacterium]
MAKSKSKESKTKTKKKKKVKNLHPKVDIYIKSSYNNTIISVTDFDGNLIASSSPGQIGFKGSRKSTAYAATKAAMDLAEELKRYGVKEANVKVKGTGMGRQAAVKGLASAGIKVKTLMDVTPIPHGGCRPRKKPRGS